MDPITSTLPFDATQSTTSIQPPAQSASDSQNQFLQLLVAQLKGQNPLNPTDGTEFVSQLAQFSSLEELTKIRSSMDSVQQLLSQSASTPGQPDTTQPTEQN
jgi:flagellar basal-body rod modification protein FlgD